MLSFSLKILVKIKCFANYPQSKEKYTCLFFIFLLTDYFLLHFFNIVQIKHSTNISSLLQFPNCIFKKSFSSILKYAVGILLYLATLKTGRRSLIRWAGARYSLLSFHFFCSVCVWTYCVEGVFESSQTSNSFLFITKSIVFSCLKLYLLNF